MVLVVVLIRSGSCVLKTWFGCQVAEQGTLLDLFNDFSAGKIDNSFPLSDTFSTASLECEIGRDKRVLTEFVRISLDVSVGKQCLLSARPPVLKRKRAVSAGGPSGSGGPSSKRHKS